jgi:hypothetical protein
MLLAVRGPMVGPAHPYLFLLGQKYAFQPAHDALNRFVIFFASCPLDLGRDQYHMRVERKVAFAFQRGASGPPLC